MGGSMLLWRRVAMVRWGQKQATTLLLTHYQMVTVKAGRKSAAHRQRVRGPSSDELYGVVRRRYEPPARLVRTTYRQSWIDGSATRPLPHTSKRCEIAW